MSAFTGSFCEIEREAVRLLPNTAYRLLNYLRARSDQSGVSYPGIELMCYDIHRSRQSVFTALDELEQAGYIVYLRRNFSDPLTGKKMSNVYLLNPFYYASSGEYKERACTLWITNGGQLCPPNPASLRKPSTENALSSSNPLDYKQQQKATTGSNDNKQIHKQQQQAVLSESESGWQPTEIELPYETSNEKQKQKPTAKTTKPRQYKDPEPIATPLPTQTEEHLANEIFGIGIPLKIARGFIVEHGIEKANLALVITKQDLRRNPGGFFRYLIENSLADAQTAMDALQDGTRYKQGKYAEFIETGAD